MLCILPTLRACITYTRDNKYQDQNSRVDIGQLKDLMFVCTCRYLYVYEYFYPHQCDQIRLNFTTLAKCVKSLANFYG